MKYLLAHDIGTSGNKATLFSEEGKLLHSITEAYPVKWFNDVWAEQNPNDWYDAVCKTTRKIIAQVPVEEIVAVSFSGQMMGCLCVDMQGTPLMNSIIWADMRGTEEEQQMRNALDPWDFYTITGHRPSASYSLAKLLWIKKHANDIYQQTHKVLQAKDYVIYKLTGIFVTDYSDASSTNLFDLNSLSWSHDIADKLNVDINKMPDPISSIDVVGHVSKRASQETGLSTSTVVVAGGGDGAMSAVGALSINENNLFTTIGTSAWNATTEKKPVFDKQMRTFNWAHVVPNMYVPCGTMQTAGASISWIKSEVSKFNQMSQDEDIYEKIETFIRKSPVGSNGVLFLPYLLGERSPRWNPNAKGAFIGINMENTINDIFRSVYEGVALNLKIILDILLNENAEAYSYTVLTGGGAKSKVFSQIFADVYNLEVRVPSDLEEATSIGAAITAGVGVGIYKDFSVVDEFIGIEEKFYPNSEAHKNYGYIKEIFDKSYYALEEIYENLHQLSKRNNI